MVNINEAFPSKYIKSSDLQGRTVRVQIDKVQFEEVGQDKDRRAVLYFIGKEKGLVLNRGNAETIQNAYGPETNDWHGADLELFVIMTEYKGQPKEGLRVRIPVRRATTPQQPPQTPPSGPPAGHPASLDNDVPF